MPQVHRSRAGSLQFWPRVRAKRIYPRIRSWFSSTQPQLLGFTGYKSGMTQVIIQDNRAGSITKGQQIPWPVTVIECPPIKLFSLKFYKNTPYGAKTSTEILVSNKFDKELSRKLNLPKNHDPEKKLKELNLDQYSEIKAVIYTQPKKTGIGKKKPELLEIAIGGEDLKAKLDYAKSLIGKEIKVSDIFKKHQIIDLHGITQGKGLQGPLKRYGLTLRSHKSEKSRRRGLLGPQGYRKVKFSAPQQGQMGYHQRTDYNKEILDLGEKYQNPKGGFLHYGLVKNDYALVKGSVPGSKKRMLVLTQSIRGKTKPSAVDIIKIGTRSQQ